MAPALAQAVGDGLVRERRRKPAAMLTLATRRTSLEAMALWNKAGGTDMAHRSSSVSNPLRVAFGIGVWFAYPIDARSEPANTLRELIAGLNACIGHPEGPPTSELTVVFALKRDGALLGKPRITFSRLVGAKDVQRAFVSDAIHALGRCLPMELTPALGNAVAGRLISVRFVSRPRETNL